jgi:hypothetical protein
MASEKEIIITFLYNRSGKSKLSFNELYLTLSMELNWFTPDDAKMFINQVINDKLLKKENDEISPNFDFNKIAVPVGFTPSKQVFEEKVELPTKKDEELVDKLVNTLVEKTNLDKKSIISKIKEIEEQKNITIEVAALLFGKEHRVSMDDYFEEIEKEIFKENKE